MLILVVLILTLALLGIILALISIATAIDTARIEIARSLWGNSKRQYPRGEEE